MTERKRERESTNRAADRGRGRSRLPAQQSAWHETWYQDPGIITWAKGRCLTYWATQAPLKFKFYLKFCFLCGFWVFLLLLYFKDFIYFFKRESKSDIERAQRKREKQIPCWAGSLRQGSIPGPWDHDSSWRQIDAKPTELLRCPLLFLERENAHEGERVG